MEERLISLLRLALKYGATDIHFVKRYSDIDISIRVDGTLKKIRSEPTDDKLIRYMQYLAGLDVGRPLYPQSGSFEMVIDNRIVPLRLASLNSGSLSDAVLRILYYDRTIDVDELSLDQSQNELFKSFFERRSGLVLLSGPTGSGKTTTLYSLMKYVKDKKIYTIEDPIEIHYENLVQLAVNEDLGFDYGEGIRQILRHDPDIILIGEIRDEKAARMAVAAANTGHLVFSTIHASHASSCISRMEELGVNVDHLYEVLLCLSNQKLMVNKDHHKQVFYELMDEKEIEYYRKNGKNSPEFRSLEERIKEAKRHGYLESQQ